jgi:hypothetical protein
MKPTILVTGDVVLDHNLYIGKRYTPDSPATCGMKHIVQPGGAMLTYGILKALNRQPLSDPPKDAPSSWDIAFGLKEMTHDDLKDWPANFITGAVWDQYEGHEKNKRVWRLSTKLGYGSSVNKGYPATPAQELNSLTPRIMVIDDGGMGFRLETSSGCWPSILTSKEVDQELQWIVLKMSRPLARGDLWRLLVNQWSEKLVVIVTVDDLRFEDVQVTRGLSWESTVDDLVDEIQSNPALSGLQACRYLIVTLRGDAALWMENPGIPETRRCSLIFDRERGEGEWEDGIKGDAYGYLSAVTASLAWHLKDTDTMSQASLVPGLKKGLSASRFLREHGHGEVSADTEPRFPFKRAAEEIMKPSHRYASSEVRCPSGICITPAVSTCSSESAVHEPMRGKQWTILRQSVHAEAFTEPLFGPARQLALLGPAALRDAPCARFGKLLTMERREIEAFRSLRQLMLSYREGGPQKQPLSLVVFGAPGSGKSFGLKQIAEGVFGEKNPVLEFNLSQFKGPEDLIGAYHQVRDQVLAGWTPVVFWDEFDSRNYFWLQYLLAPMQDGLFQEGQLTHSIGKSVFVFAGGTSCDFAHFGPSEEIRNDETEIQRKLRAEFITAKGPDFKSRLAGYLNVLGPNPLQLYNEQKAREGLNPWEDDPTDLEYPVRRAILLRSMLGFTKGKENEPLEIDRGLLTALLETGSYRHGCRSMEKLVCQMRDRGKLPLRRAHLPNDDLLSLYVFSVQEFHALTRRSNGFLAQADKLAPFFHQDWYDNLEPNEKANQNYVPYGQLPPEAKAANIAAAMRMPEILAMTGFILVEGLAAAEEEKAVGDFLDKHKELLAETEHNGWSDQKRMEGWEYGQKRNDATRKHHLLVHYADLPENEKDKDRRTIGNYPKYARAAEFKIVSERSG